jgi:hypothetical protein
MHSTRSHAVQLQFVCRCAIGVVLAFSGYLGAPPVHAAPAAVEVRFDTDLGKPPSNAQQEKARELIPVVLDALRRVANTAPTTFAWCKSVEREFQIDTPGFCASEAQTGFASKPFQVSNLKFTWVEITVDSDFEHAAPARYMFDVRYDFTVIRAGRHPAVRQSASSQRRAMAFLDYPNGVLRIQHPVDLPFISIDSSTSK